MTQERENAIQWLRAIAAIEVVVWHSDLLIKHFTFATIQSAPLYKPFGGIGVEIFFIVSGYLMCLIRPHYRSVASFMYGRLMRIVPMYWVFTTLVVVAYAINPNWKLGGSDYSLATLTKSYLVLPQSGYPILGVGWSLEYEMIFYVLVGATMLGMFGSTGVPKRWVAVILAGLGTIGLGVSTTNTSPDAWNHLFSPYMLLFAYGWSVRCIFESSSEWMRSAFLITSAAAIAGGIGYFWTVDTPEVRFVFRVLVAAGIFTVVNLARESLQNDNLVNRAGSALANASYSLYLSHWFVLSILGKVLGFLKPSPLLEIPTRGLGIAVAIVFALAVYRYVEQPLESYLRRKGPFQASRRFPRVEVATLRIVASHAALAQPVDLAAKAEVQEGAAYPAAFARWIESGRDRDV